MLLSSIDCSQPGTDLTAHRSARSNLLTVDGRRIPPLGMHDAMKGTSKAPTCSCFSRRADSESLCCVAEPDTLLCEVLVLSA